MNTTWITLIDELEEEQRFIFQSIHQQSLVLNIPYLVVGATARDLILVKAFGAHLQRATLDIDFAIKVASWGAFERLKLALLESGFQQDTRRPHRLYYVFDNHPWEVDILPFGGLAPDNLLSWPPAHTTQMSLLGFKEAHKGAWHVQIQEEPSLVLHVASPVGMVLLKLISWLDRPVEIRAKDASDLHYLIHSYAKIPLVQEQLYEQGQMEAQNWDMELAAAMKLGQEMTRLLEPETQEYLLKHYLRTATAREKLAAEMARFTHATEQESRKCLEILLTPVLNPAD